MLDNDDDELEEEIAMEENEDEFEVQENDRNNGKKISELFNLSQGKFVPYVAKAAVRNYQNKTTDYT